MQRFRREDVYASAWDLEHSIRYVMGRSGVLFIASDLCRALKYKLRNASAPNVTAALLHMQHGIRELVELEIWPDAYAPFVRFVVIDIVMATHLIARARGISPQSVAEDGDVQAWFTNAAGLARN